MKGRRSSKVEPVQRSNITYDAYGVLLKQDVLTRRGLMACVMAWTIFIGFEIFIYCDRQYAVAPLCSHNDISYDPWYSSSILVTLGGFSMIVVVLSLKIFQVGPTKSRLPLLVALQVVLMGLVATILSAFWDWGGICIDVLNVASPGGVWAEWLANGPLLVFITVTIVDKPYLTRIDWFLMVSFLVCLLCGFFIIIPTDKSVGQFWLAMSCLTYLPMMCLPFYDRSEKTLIKDSPVESGSDVVLFSHLLSEQRIKRRYLMLWLSAILPFFTVNYLLGLYEVISYAQTIAIYQLLSVATKGIFASVTMDLHVDSLAKVEKALSEEKKANEARRNFMKYLFHEVRTPLNSITMGIDMLKMSEYLQNTDHEYLDMMTGATDFMTDTLNNVLNMHKIEEGKLELDMAPFSLVEAMEKVIAALHGAIVKKKLMIVFKYGKQLPGLLVGDRFRVEHVISNLLSNAIKFSPDDKEIVIDITGTMFVDITIAITDKGPGISSANQDKLFNNFVQIRPQALQKGQGSGLGLALCKAIVELHNGTIGVESTEGVGSTFFCTIRFGLCAESDQISLKSQHDHRNQMKLLKTEERKSFSSFPAANNDISIELSPRKSITVGETPDALNEECPRSSTPVQQYSDPSLQPIHTNVDDVGQAISDSSLLPAMEEGAMNVVVRAPQMVSHPTEVFNVQGSSSPVLPTDETARGEGVVAYSKSQLKVLVVDDAEMNRKMLTALLKRSGISSDSVADGQLAVAAVTAIEGGPSGPMYRYQLVLMDNLMPIMDGITAAKNIRNQGYPYIIAGVTGNVMDDDVAEYLDAGADIVLAKPVRINSIKKLMQLIDTHGPKRVEGQVLVEHVDKMVWEHRKQKPTA